MPIRRVLILAALAAVVATLPLSPAKAQYYGPPCTPFPLTWPFCIAGAAVGAAATIVNAPFQAVAGPYYAQPYYAQPQYAQPAHYGSRRRSSLPSDHMARQLNRQELARNGY